MKVYLITLFIAQCLSAGLYISYLSQDYPRIEKQSKKSSDVINFFIAISFMVWTAILLFGGK